MNDLPLWAQGLALLLLLLVSAFFSMSETSLMAVNRYRMRNLAAQGRRGARQVLKLLGKTDQLLATILLGNNLVNAALTAMITAIAIRTFGNNDEVLAIATAVAASLLIVFAEIIPKVVGANRAEAAAMGTSYGLSPLVTIFKPLVAVINRLVSALLSVFRLKSVSGSREALTTDELRAAVLESSGFIPSQHRSILLNLFDLEDLTVDDVMVPRGNIEALDLEDDDSVLIEQITTSFHNKLLVCRGDFNQVEGILNVRRALSMIGKSEFSKERLIEMLVPAYFVPSGTKLFSQLKYFQDQKKHMALVVDE
ncbi:MAG: CNNM domain-containing protein, partial [Burkholderiaceae bacterium]